MKKKIEPYYTRLANLFGKEGQWNHSSFRTILDHLSNEWHGTSMDEKIEILEKLVNSGESLDGILFEYKQRFDAENRQDISSCAETSLIIIFEYSLRKRKKTF